MRQLQENVTKIMLAGISLVALYDVLAINKGKPAVDLVTTVVKGYGSILAIGSGQKRPAGF